MKRFIQFMVVVMMIITVTILYADEGIIQPSGNIRELIGKVISFTDNNVSEKNVWNFLIVGTSEHFTGLSKSVVIYMNKVNYYGYEIKQITYNAHSHKSWWQIEYYIPADYLKRESNREGHVREKSKPINVLSIQ